MSTTLWALCNEYYTTDTVHPWFGAVVRTLTSFHTWGGSSIL